MPNHWIAPAFSASEPSTQTIIDELISDLAPDLREELQRLALPLTRHTELSDAQLGLAHAQLAGWLQGLPALDLVLQVVPATERDVRRRA